ncbi:MAG: hypothetical protein IJ855_04390 [Bacteroidales bacterium]|nr:hypothetical protein [Bacteroidales bacterium]
MQMDLHEVVCNLAEERLRELVRDKVADAVLREEMIIILGALITILGSALEDSVHWYTDNFIDALNYQNVLM